MGDPKKQRKKYDTPRFPWQSDILKRELLIIGLYGLRNKKELWRNRTILSKFRATARSILSMSYEKRRDLEDQLINKLRRIGILHETAGLDDVLDLQIEDILERRLQTIVFRRNMANSIHQARQLIVHRHISIEGKRISSPSYLVLRGEDEKIAYSPHSPLLNSDHPLRKTLEMVVE